MEGYKRLGLNNQKFSYQGGSNPPKFLENNKKKKNPLDIPHDELTKLFKKY